MLVTNSHRPLAGRGRQASRSRASRLASLNMRSSSALDSFMSRLSCSELALASQLDHHIVALIQLLQIFGIDRTVEHTLHARPIQRADPAGDGHRPDGIADGVGNGTSLRHEAVAA